MSRTEWEKHIRSLGLDVDLNAAYHRHHNEHPRCRVCKARRLTVRRNLKSGWHRAAHQSEVHA